MKIGVLKEIHAGEKRVATTPDVTEKLIKFGFDVMVESGAGAGANYSDKSYLAAGATIGRDAKSIWGSSDLIIKVRAPQNNVNTDVHEIEVLTEELVLMTFRYSLDTERDDGEPGFSVSGRGSMVWSGDVEDDLWKIHTQHLSVRLGSGDVLR